MSNKKEIYEKAIEYYLNNETISITQVAKKFGIDRCNLGLKLKQIKNVNRKSKYSYDENFFEIIDSEEKAYWLGFLLADGNNTKRTLRFRLKLEDKYILERFLKSINGNIPIKEDKVNLNGKIIFSCNLTISSVKMCKDVEKYGIIPNKTYDNHAAMTKELCNSIKNFLEKELNIEKISITKIKNIYRLRITSKENILKFFHLIIENPDNLFLDRKYIKIKSFAALNESAK
jgi:hypothetical protein